MKKIVYTRIDTSETAPSNQGELLRVWDRSWRLRGWKTKILLPEEDAPLGALETHYWSINFSFRSGSARIQVFGEIGWTEAPVVHFPSDITEQQILECGRSLT